jgi:tetratricopeptide (TPR) repeat protein
MSRVRVHRFAISLLTAVAFIAMQIPTRAFAQNSAQAEVLFKEGQQLMTEKKFEEACQRLTASFKLDPQPNTELLQGECFKNLKKTASAYNAYLDASTTLARGSDAQKYAADQAKALEAQLLKVRVQVTPLAAGLQMKFDDDTKTRDKDFVGIDIALDPGEHDVTVTAPGKHDFTKHFTLDSTNSPHTIVVNLTDKTKEELDAEQHTGGGGNVIVEKPDVQWSTVKTLGMVGIIVGGAAVVGAAVTQILAFVFQGDATTLQTRSGTANCPTLSPPAGQPNPNNTSDANCNSAVSYHSQALAAQSAAIGLAIGGGIVAIAGIVMFVVGGTVTKEPDKKASLHIVPLVSPNFAGLSIGGTF